MLFNLSASVGQELHLYWLKMATGNYKKVTRIKGHVRKRKGKRKCERTEEKDAEMGREQEQDSTQACKESSLAQQDCLEETDVESRAER